MGDNKYDILRFLHKHLVPLSVIFTKENKACLYLVTSFVLSAEDKWFLVTARTCRSGHQ